MNTQPPAWQPTRPTPWPDQVNARLDELAHGLTDAERTIAQHQQEIADLHSAFNLLERSLAAMRHMLESGDSIL